MKKPKVPNKGIVLSLSRIPSESIFRCEIAHVYFLQMTHLGQVLCLIYNSRARSFMQVFHVGSRDTSIWAIFYCFSKAISRQVQKWSYWDTNSAHMGCQHSRQQLIPLWHNASSEFNYFEIGKTEKCMWCKHTGRIGLRRFNMYRRVYKLIMRTMWLHLPLIHP